MMIRPALAILSAVAMFALVAPLAKAQTSAGAGGSPTSGNLAPPRAAAVNVQPGTTYTRPTEGQKLRTYVFDAFGPYAIIGAAAAAGVQQASGSRLNGGGSGSPPEWGGGGSGYIARFGSNYGINVTANTSRYLLGELFREDTSYYRCDCSGFGHRFGHALVSTVTARHGDDGRYRFSFPNFSAPYAGTMTAVLAWYPGRYNPSDGFRMGNYALATAAGINIAKEFIYGGPHTLMGKIHHKN